MEENYWQKEETKMSLLEANTNCDELLRDIKKEETPKFWHKIRFIKKVLQDIITEVSEKQEIKSLSTSKKEGTELSSKH